MEEMFRLQQYEPLWGDWHVDTLLHEGSLSNVYQVKNRNTTGVIKVISVPKLQPEGRLATQNVNENHDTMNSFFKEVVGALVEEIERVSVLDHVPNVLGYRKWQVFDRKEDVGYDLVLLMDKEESLKDYLSSRDTVNNAELVRIVKEVAWILGKAHQEGIVHKNIKIENIFIAENGESMLADFSLTRKVESYQSRSQRKADPTYKAPEILSEYDYNESTDIYALGMVLYLLLNEQRIPAELLKRSLKKELPKPCRAGEELTKLVFRAISYRSKDRFSSADEFFHALSELREEELQLPKEYISHAEESKRKEEERKAEEERLKQEEEERKAEEERLKQEEEERKAEEERLKQEEEERKAEEERLKQEEERKAEEERLRQEEEERKAEEERLKQEEEERKAEEERLRQEEEERKAEEERLKQEEEERKAEEERLKQEEEERKAEEERLRQEEEERKAEEERLKQEEEERKAEEERLKQEEEERKAEEERLKQEEEERKAEEQRLEHEKQETEEMRQAQEEQKRIEETKKDEERRRQQEEELKKRLRIEAEKVRIRAAEEKAAEEREELGKMAQRQEYDLCGEATLDGAAAGLWKSVEEMKQAADDAEETIQRVEVDVNGRLPYDRDAEPSKKFTDYSSEYDEKLLDEVFEEVNEMQYKEKELVPREEQEESVSELANSSLFEQMLDKKDVASEYELHSDATEYSSFFDFNQSTYKEKEKEVPYDKSLDADPFEQKMERFPKESVKKSPLVIVLVLFLLCGLIAYGWHNQEVRDKVKSWFFDISEYIEEQMEMRIHCEKIFESND